MPPRCWRGFVAPDRHSGRSHLLVLAVAVCAVVPLVSAMVPHVSSTGFPETRASPFYGQPSQGPLVARIVFPAGTIVGDGLYFELTHVLNVAPLNLSLHSSVTGGQPPYSYRWDFGDGSPANSSASVVHVYADPGYYILHLTVTDAGGNESIAWAGLSAYPGSAPAGQDTTSLYHTMISLGPTQGIAPLSVGYGFNGYGGPGGPVVFPRVLKYSFGDGSPDATYSFPNNTINWSPSIAHNYTSPGEYLMTLNATESVNGATAYSVSAETVIVLGPHGPPMVVPDTLSSWVSYNTSANSEQQDFWARILGDPTQNISIWSPGDGSPPLIGNPLTYNYTLPESASTEYTLQYTALFGTNLTLTSQHTIEVNPLVPVSSSSAAALNPLLVGLAIGLGVGSIAVGVALYVAYRSFRHRSPPTN